ISKSKKAWTRFNISCHRQLNIASRRKFSKGDD
ncbi:unnamed protein product, partial [Allacma fusca]